MKKVRSTFSLVLDTLPASFSLIMNITKVQAKREHKKWMNKIKKNQWVSIPTDDELPVMINTSAVIALRVCEISPEDERLQQMAENPVVDSIIRGSNKMSAKITSQNTDMGYK